MEQYSLKFESDTNIEELTIDEAEKKYNIKIHKDSLGYDRGTMFDTIAIKLNRIGNYTIVCYLPHNSSCHKKYDFLIYIKGV